MTFDRVPLTVLLRAKLVKIEELKNKKLKKTQIAQIGKKIGIDYAETWSCYKGGAHHCGKCGTCVERREALADAGIVDTTEYETL